MFQFDQSAASVVAKTAKEKKILNRWSNSAALFFCVLMALPCGCATENKPPVVVEETSVKNITQQLFDGETIDQWELTSFGGEGDCYVEDGMIVLSAGDPVTAINLPEEFSLPTDDYELLVEAKRVEGSDFFATITFPVGDSFCSLVVGGWAGTLVGLSSIDGKDASENQTRTLQKFEDDRWYAIRLRVADDNISAWIDDQSVVNLSTVGKTVSLRSEMIPCRPLGIASYITTAAIRKVALTRLESGTDDK